jgi:hypothetical protein
MKAVKFAASLEPLLVPLSSVHQHQFNPNMGDLEKLIESIKVNGFLTAITADSKTGAIIAGNHRWQALHALGATHIPVIWHEFSEESGTRFLIGDNATGQAAVLDKALVIPMLQDLQESELGLFGTGFDDDSLNTLMLRQLEEQEQKLGEGHGFGAGESAAGIFQIVITFNDSEERDEVQTAIADRWPELQLREVNL